MIKKKLIPLFIILVALALFLMPVYAGTNHKVCVAYKDGWKCNNVLTAGVDECTNSADCINIATAKIYSKLTGEITAKIFGTEYVTGENGTIWLQLLRNYAPIVDATCYAIAYNPDKSILYDNILMTYLYGSDGIYYYDFTVPNVVGVYMLSARCLVPTVNWVDEITNSSKIEVSNNISIVGGKAKLSTYNATTVLNYTDGTWESTLLLIGINETSAVYFDLGNISTDTVVNNNLSLCFYASKKNSANFANITNNLTRISPIPLPVLATPAAWVCVNVSKTQFHDGINRIGLQCTVACTPTNYVGIRIDQTAPNNNSYFYSTATGWLNASFYDTGIRLFYTVVRSYENGNLRSIPITLNGTIWYTFGAEYLANGGNITFKVLNGTNSVLCSDKGDIIGCANTTTPIKLYAEFTRPTGISPELDRWYISWLSETVEETRGVGEFHVSLPVNFTAITDLILAHNQTVMNKLDVIESEILSANNTASIWFSYLNGSIVRIESKIDNITVNIGNLNLSIDDLRSLLIAVNQTIMNKLVIIDGKADTIILNLANNTATLVSVNKTVNDRLDTVVGDLSMLNTKIDNLSINIGDYFTSINDSIWLGGGIMERMQYYFHYSMEQLDATNEKILAINQSTMNKLYLMQDDLANITYIVSHLNINMSEVLDMLQAVNQTVYNKLVLIQGDIISVNNSVIDLNDAMVSQFSNTNGKIDTVNNNVLYMSGNLQAINQTVMWWIHDIKDEIKEINFTVGNLNLTIYLNSTSPKEVWQYFTAMSAAEAPSVNGITGATVGVAHALDSMCINSTHIQRFGNTNVCYGGDCFGVGVNRTETCQYGCDLSRNECKGSPTESWFWAGLIILIFIVAIVAIWRYLS
jgi:hypothetical protein